MKTAGLIGAGSVATSPFARLPLFLERLEPVKGSSMRVASRISNSLQSGTPTASFESLEPCQVIFIIVPDSRVRELVAEMIASPVSWKGKAIVLCDTWLDSSELTPLAMSGADTATLCELDPLPGGQCLIEGTHDAVKEAKRLLGDDATCVLVVAQQAKPLIYAALTLSESLLFPLLDSASECLKKAGMPRAQATAFLEAAIGRASRNFAKSGRKAWSGPLPGADACAINRQIEVLWKTDPELARFFARNCAEAVTYFGGSSAWIAAKAGAETVGA